MEKMKSEFEKIVKEKLTNSKISPDIAIQSINEFYENYKTPHTDVDENSDDDMLLFQYGIQDWEGTGPKFEFNLTRQITIPDDDEFYQFSLTINYESNVDTTNIESYNLWSIDCDSIESWIDEIKKTDGYKVASNLKPLDYIIELRET
jgi:hypothetical protein